MLDTLLHKHLHVPYRLHVHTDQKAKSPRATVLLLHGLGESAVAWDKVVERLPNDIRIISVDLLGFGQSPSPRWMKYNITVQARSVIATLMRLSIRRQLIIIGHSMGSLTAIEIAKRYPYLVRGLVLCSPPLYTREERRSLIPNRNKMLRDFYEFVIKNPQKAVGIAALVMKLKIVDKSFEVTAKNVDIYLGALESSIIHQTSLHDAKNIRKPTRIIHGLLDPVVIKKNLDAVPKAQPNTRLTVVLAGHELTGKYANAINDAVEGLIDGNRKASEMQAENN